MKSIKSIFLIALFLTIGSVAIISCTDDSSSTTNSNAKANLFLKSFYNREFAIGKSVESKGGIVLSSLSRSVEMEDIVVTEVFVGGEERARGYLVTDKANNDLLYFIDVDRVDFKLITVDIKADNQQTFENIDSLDKYLLTDELDYIKIAEDIQIDGDSEAARRFWGREYTLGAPFEGIDGNCYQGVYSTYYVFGINVNGGPRAVQNDNGNNVYVPCGTTYQP